MLHTKGAPFAELVLGDETLLDEALLDELMANSVLINRPLVVSMLLKIDFGSIGSVRQHLKGVGVTLFVNWAVKSFSMAPRDRFGVLVTALQ